jgi:signal transduction histidine kinase
MLKPLRVLLVEDSENDAFIISRELTKGGYDLSCERVDTEEGMRQKLREAIWDVILADYSMPMFNGLEALKILQESGLDIPFIIVSGAIGEETAVATMKAGAHDYLLKDKLHRLVPAIERELKEVQVRQAKREEEEARLQLEKKLQQAKDVAEAANQRKSRVLAFVAHELKNPLKAVETFAEILEKDYAREKLDNNQLTLVQGISTACHHIRELMNDILDIAPIEAGQIVLHYETVDLKTLLDEVRIIVGEAARQRNITLQFEIEPDFPLLRVDPKRIRQIFINLFSNATKYSHADDVVQLHACQKDGGLEITVSDHGPGIPEAELNKLFLEYYRVQNTLSKQNEGLGLGLALVKNLVELHEGEIKVESILGEGTTFIISLPGSAKAFAKSSASELKLEMAR